MDCKERILSEEYLDIMEETLVYGRLEERFQDYCVVPISDNISNIYVNRKEAEGLFPNEEMYSVLPKCYGLVGGEVSGTPGREFNFTALTQSGVLSLQRPPLNLTGRGVILAILDNGIDFQNPLFLNPDGTTRILALWDQTDQSGFPPPGFFYGSLRLPDEINALISENQKEDYVNQVQKNAHGTMMAAVASGSHKTDNFMFTSPAPETSIVVVKLKQAKRYLTELYKIPADTECFEETDILTGLSFVRQFLSVARQPVVICMGLGTSFGNRSGRGVLGNYIQELMSNRNISLVCPLGNEGNARKHYEGFFSMGRKEVQRVEMSVSPENPGFFMEFWAKEPALFRLNLRSPAGEQTGFIDEKGRGAMSYEYIYGGGKVEVFYVLSEDFTGWQAVFFRFQNPPEGVWILEVENVDDSVISEYHVWLPMEQFLTKPVYFLKSSPYVTLTSPSGNRGVISVSGYDTLNGGFFAESSRGYTSEGMVKPDLAAPAMRISTPYGERSGTELAAALVAGAVCQLMEWAVIQGNDPYIDSNGIKNYLTRGALRRPQTTYPNREWGYGTLNMERVFDVLAGIERDT